MKYFVINKFIEDKVCKRIIDNFDNSDLAKNYLIHGSRKVYTSSSLEFNELISNSSDFKNLTEKLNSNEFFETCLEKLSINKNNFIIKNFFKIKNPSKFHKFYKRLNNLKLNFLPARSLAKYLIFRCYRYCCRKIKFSSIFYPKKKPVELLYDFSIASNGYSKDIHRDSDNRLVVFLLYLNDLPINNNANGGDLEIYKLAHGSKNSTQPSKETCEKIESIKPEAGKLIVFLNNNESFHAVSEMQNFKDCRYFFYGGFTLLNHKNPYITNKTKSPTDFDVYE